MWPSNKSSTGSGAAIDVGVLNTSPHILETWIRNDQQDGWTTEISYLKMRVIEMRPQVAAYLEMSFTGI